MGQLKMRGIRGPASYSAGGFDATLGDYEYVVVSSGRHVQAVSVSSSPFIPQVVTVSGNIATIILRDLRSGGIEPTSGDFSNRQFTVTYEGV